MAAITTKGAYARLRMKGRMFGAAVEQEFLWWFLEDPADPPTPEEVYLTFYTDLWSDATNGLQNYLHTAYRLESVKITTGSLFGDGPPTQEGQFVVDETGDYSTGDPLPSFITVVMARIPDNTQIYSVDPAAPAFNRLYYRNGFAGVPEDASEGNTLDAVWQPLYAASFLNFLNPSFGGDTFTLMVDRTTNTLVGGNEPAYAFCDDLYVRNRLGSQVSRKG